MKAPISYYGGKARLSGWITSLMGPQSYLSSLRRNGLADVDGALVTASPTLFLGTR